MFFSFAPSAVQIDYFPFGRLIGPFLTLAILVLIFVCRDRASVKSKGITSLPVSMLFGFLILLVGLFNSAEWNNSLVGSGKIILCFALYYLARWYVSSLRENARITVIVLAVPVILVVADIFYRLSLANYNSVLTNFYVFKTESMMFYDSNAAAMYIASWLFVALALTSYIVKSNESVDGYNLSRRMKSQLLGTRVAGLMLAIALILTLSRAAIIGLIVSILFSLLLASKKALYKVTAGVILIAGVVGATVLTPAIVAIDGSFAGKIMIYEELLQYVASPDTDLFDFLFGVGMVDGIYEISYIPGFHSHTLVSTLVGQIGVVGVLLYLVWIMIEAARSGHWFAGLFVFIFVSGLSYTNPFYETFFLAFGIVSALAVNRTEIA